MLLEITNNLADRPISQTLRDVLLAENTSLPQSAARKKSLDKLHDPKTVYVITGQQLGLFLGPAFTIYKALGAIKLAEYLESKLQRPVVPIFWLQSEDHDIKEVSSAAFFSADGQLSHFSLPFSEEEHVSLAHRKLDSSVNDFFRQISESLKLSKEEADRLEIFTSAYQGGRTYLDAFKETLGQVFRDYGLIVFNPRIKIVSELLSPLYQQALDNYTEIAALLTSEKSQQVYVRENSPLFFYHLKDETGPRFRLEKTKDSFSLVGHNSEVTDKELRHVIADEPLRISASALFRPLVQDTLFPTAAYVAGEAEVRYMKQLSPVYKFLDLQQPWIQPRPSFSLIEARSRRLLEQLGYTFDKVLPSKKDFVNSLMLASIDQTRTPDALYRLANEHVKASLDVFKQAFSEVDPGALSIVSRAEDKITRALNPLREKYASALTNSKQILSERAEKLHRYIYPDEKPQERVISGFYYYVRHGESFIGRIEQEIELSRTETCPIFL